MSGSPEQKSESVFLNPKIQAIMDAYKVNEETATKLSVYATAIAQELMAKWCRNTLKRRRIEAEEIYVLLKKLKTTEDWLDPVLAEIEKKVLKMCVDVNCQENP